MSDAAQALQAGSRLDRLKGLRDVLAAAIVDSDSGRDIAALSRQFADILDKIEAAEVASAPVKGTTLDEFSKRRARSSTASGGARSAV